MHPTLKQIIKRIFRFMGLEVRKLDRDLPESWSNIKDFQLLLKEVEGRILITRDRSFMLYQLARYANRKKGEIAEVGVFKGGTGKLIAKSCPNKIIHLFDTFSGLPKGDPSIEHFEEGGFSETSFESVQEFFKDCDNVVFHPGFFPDTADAIKDKSFCLVYIDADIYQSIKDCLEFFYDKMVLGGIMLFDDYGWERCPGVKKAMTEFLIDKDEVPIMTARYQCMLIKL